MSAVSSVSNPLLNSTTAATDSKSADAKGSQAFDHVFAREVNRQTQDTPKQGNAQDEKSAEAKTDTSAEKSEAASSTDAQQQAAASWLLMMQQAAQNMAPTTVQDSSLTEGGTETTLGDNLDQTPGRRDWLLQLAQQGALKNSATPAGNGESAASAKGDKSALTVGVDSSNPAPQAAMVTATNGKNLPQTGLDDSAKTDFSDELIGKMDAASNKLPQASSSGSAPTSSVNEARSNTNVVQHTVHEVVGDSRWSGAVAQRVSMMLGRQEQQMEMQLNPPHLGPMEVRLTVGGDQASVVFASQNAGVREALAAATPKLTSLLADQGIHLVNVQVASDSLNQQAQNQSQQQQAATFSQGNPSDSRRDNPRYGVTVGSEEIRAIGNVSLPVARSGVSLYI